MGLLRRKTESEVDRDTPERRAAVRVGVPGRCPECDGFGYIDNIDMRFRIQTQHCRDCGQLWEFSFDTAGDVIDLTDGANAASTPRESTSH